MLAYPFCLPCFLLRRAAAEAQVAERGRLENEHAIAQEQARVAAETAFNERCAELAAARSSLAELATQLQSVGRSYVL